LAGVSVDRLTGAPLAESEYQPESGRVPRPGLDLLDVRIAYSVRPEFVDGEPYVPVLDITPREDSPQMRGVKNLLQREFFRQVRKHLKRQWRHTLSSLPDLRYESYESTALKINRIGRDAVYLDEPAPDYYTTQVREDVFQRGAEGEEDLPVLSLGPVILLDSGSVNIDLRSIRDLLFPRGDSRPPALEVAPELSKIRRPLLSGESYRLSTRCRIDLDPFRIARRGEVLDSVRSVGGVMEVTWLTDILRKERFKTECEAQYRNDGDLVVFFNFVLNSR